MSFKWSDLDSKFTMFDKNIDMFNKDGLFNIIELPGKEMTNTPQNIDTNLIKDLEHKKVNTDDSITFFEPQQKNNESNVPNKLKLDINLANEERSQPDDNMDDEKMKQQAMTAQYQMMQRFQMMNNMRRMSQMQMFQESRNSEYAQENNCTYDA